MGNVKIIVALRAILINKFKFVELTEMEQEYIVRELLWDKMTGVMDDKQKESKVKNHVNSINVRIRTS